MQKTDYGQDFFDIHTLGASMSAARLVPIVNKIVKPQSVLDVGGGNGAWLQIWERVGVKKYLGVDGDYVEQDKLLIPAKKFKPHDLTQPLKLRKKFDLVMSLEVAEHLDEEYARTFIDSLTRHSDVVFFSAALPGQGGTHHVNERWPSYWADHFAALGYGCYDVLRPLVWEQTDIEVWYRQNCMIFATEAAAKRLKLKKSKSPLDIVHPDMFAFEVSKHVSSPNVEVQTASLKVALKQSLAGSAAGPVLRKINQARRKVLS